METENKHPDSANDSVDSFEDAIDHLDLSEDNKNLFKPEDNNQPSNLTSEINQCNKAALVCTANKDCDSKNSITDINISNREDVKESLEELDTASGAIDKEKTSSETLAFSLVNNVKNITNDVSTSNLTSDGILLCKNADLVSDQNNTHQSLKASTDSDIILEDVKTSVKSMNTSNGAIDKEKTSSESPVLSSVNDVKIVTNCIDNITNNLSDVHMNKTEFVSSVPSDSSTIKNEMSDSNDKLSTLEPPKEEIPQDTSDMEVEKKVIKENAIEILSQEEIPQNNATEKIVKESEKEELLNLQKHHVLTNHKNGKDNLNEELAIKNKDIVKETSIEEVSKESVKEEISLNNDTVSDVVKKVKESSQEPNDETNENMDNTDGEDDGNDDEGSIKSEREQGDGQGEQEEVKKELQLDEDKRNPEYIPKKGSFFEHDTRTMDGFDDDVKKIEEEIATKSRKKPKPISAESKWTHDKYDEQEQGPKTLQEIIDTYGYDIRNEEHPPKARRNRRYGRGPNKYSRNWEDEKAYIKIENKGPRNPEARHNRSVNDRMRQNKPFAREEDIENENSTRTNAEWPTLTPAAAADTDKTPAPFHYPDKIGMKAEKGAWVPPPPFSQKNVVAKIHHVAESDSTKPQASSPRSLPPPKEQPLSPLTVVEKSSPPKPKSFSSLPLSNVAAFVPAPVCGARFPLKAPQPMKAPSTMNVPNWFLNQNKVERTGPLESPELPHIKDFSKLPGGVAALRGGKRYSVQRQQSLEAARSASVTGNVPAAEMEALTVDDGSGPPGQTLPPSAYYHHSATGPAPPITVPQSSPSHLVFTQSPPPPVKVLAADAPCYHSHLYTPETNHPISNGAGGAPPMLLPVHFVSPPPSQVPAFNNPPAPIMSYAPQPLQFQPMQPIVSLPPPPQTEVFQPAGGITYYSPQTQAVLQRPALSKRVKSAIPIVPPSEVNNIHQSSLVQQQDVLPSNLMQQHVQLVPVESNKEDGLSN